MASVSPQLVKSFLTDIKPAGLVSVPVRPSPGSYCRVKQCVHSHLVLMVKQHNLHWPGEASVKQ